MEDAKCHHADYPYLCPVGTKNFGLCVNKLDDCVNKINRKSEMQPKINSDDEVGKAYAYISEHLHDDCSGITPINMDEYSDGEPVPGNLKVCSWNVWGLLKYDQPFIGWSLEKRLNNIIDIILEEDLDIICLQEITTPVYLKLLQRLGSIYHFYEEVIDTDKTKKERNRDLELLFLSKYKAHKSITFLLGGNLGYSNNLSVLEFPNLVIFGCYLQAGSKYSPGQEKKWFHYSRCRSEQLETIFNLSKSYTHDKKIVLGDINFHLDGPISNWPELEKINSFNEDGFIDSFRSLFPNIETFPGYTEDTNVNLMRYNSKFMEKQFRYDGIMSKGLTPVDCKVLGTNEIELTDEEITNMIDQFVFVRNIDKIRVSKNADGSNRKLALWPSDHFGIMSVFRD